MITLVPRLHAMVGSAASRNVAQLRELGVEPSARSVRIGVTVGASPGPAQWLLTATLVDMLLRLDPLVGAVIVDGADAATESMATELGVCLPLALEERGRPADFSVGVGIGGFDLMIDGAGWIATIGEPAAISDDGNPVGPLTAAAFGAAEVFKWAFAAVYPDRAQLVEMVPWRGRFSAFSYDLDSVSPPLPDVRISTTLVGTGGVGAGFIRTVAALGLRVAGTLDLVDDDVLTTHNLNRVSYATLAGAEAGADKVAEAKSYLQRKCPNLAVADHAEKFAAFKARTPRRADRLYDVIVTGLDDDQVRWEVQRDLPRILIDGSTGKDLVARVERVEFGRYGCLGCSRRPSPAAVGGHQACDVAPDPYAPSLSFVSALPGILAAGEVLKEALGGGGLRGHFDHVFRYGPNPDLSGTPAIRGDCQVSCGKPSKLDQYRKKYPNEPFEKVIAGDLDAIEVPVVPPRPGCLRCDGREQRDGAESG